MRCSALAPSWDTELTIALTVLVTVVAVLVAVVCAPVTITGVGSEPGAWSPAFPLGTRFGYTGGTPESKPQRTGASLLLLFLFFPLVFRLAILPDWSCSGLFTSSGGGGFVSPFRDCNCRHTVLEVIF